jgi:hypothetical protein
MTHHGRGHGLHRGKTHRRHYRSSPADVLAQGLGWFSIGLGVLELVAARDIARGLGAPGGQQVLRAYGLREVANGIGILASRDRRPWIWGRVAGDAMDIATLAAEGEPYGRTQRARWRLAIGSVLGIAALDLACALTLGRRHRRERARRTARNYGDRSGLPRSPEEMCGAARDFAAPRDMRIPEPLRPWTPTGAAPA